MSSSTHTPQGFEPGAVLRILQLYPKGDYFTGAAIQLHELARGLKARGHDVAVATHPSRIWSDKARDAGIAYYPLPMKSALSFRSVTTLIRILRERRIQIVHAQKGRARTLALFAGLFVKIPVLIVNRGVSFPLNPFNRLGYATRRVAAIVAVSESIKRHLIREEGIPEQKIAVIYSGTDTDRFHPGLDGAGIRKELGFGPEHFLITQIGIRSVRGNVDLLDAMVTIATRAPHARLLLVGANEARVRQLRDQAEARGIHQRVSIFSYREDVPDILAASDCCVDASYAGLGLTGALREALAVETPVVATDVEGNPELVRHGETGLLVPARAPSALAEAVLAMLENPTNARAMARAGRKLVEEKFSTRIKVERTEQLYRRLLAERERKR
ncbi:MAG TPA: glycosyltransferase family 4 protein [Methylomirabilota bacterium]|nr:glycosyltransferase family 4 protein [Methylomirabilota bacterium]